MTTGPPGAEDGPGLESDVAARLRRCRPAREGGAYTALLEERALEVARSSARRSGPLHGLTLAIKDNIAVRGHRQEAGSRSRSEYPVRSIDAEIVSVLLEAGAVPIGLTALHELAFGVTGINAYTGTPANPAARGRVPGGSSSGSAVAVAEGTADIAVGTDTGGSIRIPAALCGVVGYKPSFGRFPVAGALHLAPSLDHVGVLTSSVALARTVDRAVVSTRGPTQSGPPVFGLDATRLEGADRSVADAVSDAVDRVATRYAVVDIRLPGAEEVVSLTNTIMFFEAARAFGHLARIDADGLGGDVRSRLETGLKITEAEYRGARARAAPLAASVRRTLAEIDAVVEPTVPIVAPPIDDAPGLGFRLVAHTRLANVTGLPAISLPIATTGPPVGLQLTAADSDALLAVAALVEELVATPGGSEVG